MQNNNKGNNVTNACLVGGINKSNGFCILCPAYRVCNSKPHKQMPTELVYSTPNSQKS